jgi:hypothetical protein
MTDAYGSWRLGEEAASSKHSTNHASKYVQDTAEEQTKTPTVLLHIVVTDHAALASPDLI